uniref:Carboxylic ester hydrolase n=2 Tax=Arion vulgaris TaxID=1028688 RepID=A0A0B7AIE7_9EUPU
MLFVIIIYAILPYIFSSSEIINKESGNHVDQHADSTTDPLLVNTRYGPIRGTNKKGVRVFHGIPYTKPPIGDRRWRPPSDPEPWSPHTLDATKIRPGCPQECTNPLYCSNSTSEDCLFLEIYTPVNITTPVSVTVYIHGGSFKDVTCTLALYDATQFVLKTNIIMVLIEYRIGVLGFLVTGEGEDQATGNYGIQDQRQALMWVNANIRAFGGDPDKVTLVGQSAGAQSVLIHLCSDLIPKYFRSVIVESTPLTVLYKTPKVASRNGKTFARNLKCVDKKNRAINMTCLRKKTVSQIINSQKKSSNGLKLSVTDRIEPLRPVIDGTFVKLQPLEALQHYATTTKQTMPMIFSHTTEEGVFFIKEVLAISVPALLYQFILHTVFTSVPRNIERLYPVTNRKDISKQLSQIITDLIFRCPLRYLIKLLKTERHGDRIWLYQWDKPLAIDLPTTYKSCNSQACHSAEIPFVFQSFSEVAHNSSPEDIETSNKLIAYYANFINFGNPNVDTNQTVKSGIVYKQNSVRSEDKLHLINWPTVNFSPNDTNTQLIFSRDGHLEIIEDLKVAQCDAWDKTGYSILRGK